MERVFLANWRRMSLHGRRAAVTLALFVPFGAGYFLSYLFRTINGPIAGSLTGAFDLGPRELGVLTALYFLAFASFQIPAGLLIDRHGPHRVQVGLLVVAAAGALLFAVAPSLPALMAGRALIGLGCSGALVTGVKALSLWLPPERRALGNCFMVMAGGLGAVASTTPLEALARVLQWRGIFALLAATTALLAALVWRVRPQRDDPAQPPSRDMGAGLRAVLRDPRFWRVAPLSASVVGAAFAIHGLWAARWLADVGRLGSHAVNTALLVMGVTLTCGALTFGLLATALRRRGVTTTTLFVASCLVFIAVECLITTGGVRFPAALLGVFAVFGSITVLSFTIVGELFPQVLVGRANGVLNVLHLGTAFAFQAGIGGIVALWPALPDRSPPPGAYSVAFGAIVAVQCAALAWFALSAPASPWRRAWWRCAGPGGRGPDTALARSASRVLASHGDLDAAERRAVRRALLIGLVVAGVGSVGVMVAAALRPGADLVADLKP